MHYLSLLRAFCYPFVASNEFRKEGTERLIAMGCSEMSWSLECDTSPDGQTADVNISMADHIVHGCHVRPMPPPA